MEANTIQIFIVAAQGASALFAGAAAFYVFHAKREIVGDIKTWIRQQHYITKSELSASLDAFADKFELRLIEKLNGPNGFQRKSACSMYEDRNSEDWQECKQNWVQCQKQIAKLVERIERR